MPNYLSPGVYSTLTDASQYVAPTATTILGLVGAAKRGPLLGAYNATTKSYNEPVLITSPAEFVATFGEPDPNMQGPYAAMLYLQQGSQLLYGRVAGSGSAAATIVSGAVTFTATSPGTWGNALKVVIAASTNGTGMVKATVLETVSGVDQVRSSYEPISADPTSDYFWEKVFAGDTLVSVDYDESLTTQPSPGTSSLAGGADGAAPGDSDIIGVQNSGYATGLQAFADKDQITIRLIAAPGYSSPAVCTALSTIATGRKDCLALIHGPLGLNAQEIVQWHNATSPFDSGGSTPSVQINNHNCALYWPWVKIYDPFAARNVWVPPVGFAAQSIAFTDNTAETWFAPAGITRGKLPQAVAIEYNASQGDRDFMYGPGNGNAVNPIVKLPLDGITIYGQRTMQRNPSALDRINVVRLQHFMDDALTKAARVLVFEQNDPILWKQLKQLVTPFLQDIQNRRGLESFSVVCDATTNPPSVRNNGECHGFIEYVPVKSAEKIVLNFTVNASGSASTTPAIAS